MLKITIPSRELFDNDTQMFVYSKEQTILLEHSLVSISKWEAITEKAFIGNSEKSIDDTMLYIQCMTVSKNIDEKVYAALSDENINAVKNYIDKKNTATTINKFYNGGGSSGDVVTSELIYYWMLCHKIPFECQRWHLNRLLTLIDICNVKNAPPQKMSRSALAQRNKSLNAQRRAQMNSRG